MIIIILLAVSPFVNPSTLFEINPILETASVSRMRCADLSNIVGFQRCASPVELPSSRFYEVKIAVYLYLDARTSASGAQLSCSTHVCDCAAQSPCLNCNVDGAKEHLCRARIDQSDAGTHTVILFGYVNPSDASEPISLASRFAFRVYASTNDDDGAAALEGTVASLGPWFEFNHRWVLHPDGDDDSPPDALHHAGVREDGSGVFSRVACTGVTHDFEQGEDIIRNWDGHRGGGYMSSRQNVCVFENVCLSGGGVLSMYLPPHPEGLPSESTAYNEERNHIGYVRLSSFESWEGRYSQTYSGNATQGDYAGWRPDVKRASIPKTSRFAHDAELHVFQRHSHFFQNYGHLLLDDLLAAFAGMELFSIATLNATLVLMPDCPCCFPETAHELCARFFWNNDSMSRSLFVGGAKQLTAYSDGTCFKKVLMGHSSALSCAYPNPLLSVVVRKFRAALVSGVVGESARYHSHQWLRGTEAALMNISGEQDEGWNSLKWKDVHHCSNSSASEFCKSSFDFCHRILIYNKTSGYSTKDTMKAVADVCAIVPHLLKRMNSCTRIICSDPASMALRSQLLLMSSATVIVSPHGGISSNLLFSNDGAAALLLVGPGDKQRRGAKDTNIYPWLTWLTVRYWLGTGNQDKILDLMNHVVLLAQRVQNNLLL